MKTDDGQFDKHYHKKDMEDERVHADQEFDSALPDNISLGDEMEEREARSRIPEIGSHDLEQHPQSLDLFGGNI